MIVAIFIATACIIVWVINWAIDNTKINVCEHTPMNQMTDKQWKECLEVIR